MHLIPKQPFGATGHDSSRIIFGAAALAATDPDGADIILDELLAAGINHIVVTASDAGLMRQSVEAAGRFTAGPSREAMNSAWERLGVEPLFVAGQDDVGRAVE